MASSATVARKTSVKPGVRFHTNRAPDFCAHIDIEAARRDARAIDSAIRATLLAPQLFS
jgi:hypothetical protein